MMLFSFLIKYRWWIIVSFYLRIKDIKFNNKLRRWRKGVNRTCFKCSNPVFLTSIWPLSTPNSLSQRTYKYSRRLSQMIISQLGLPQNVHISQEIANMKNAVDKQELKIQKSLVNDEDILGDIINRGAGKNEKIPAFYHSKNEIDMEDEN